MPYFLPVIGAIVTALIAFGVYRYRNRIAYSVTSIVGKIPEDNGKITKSPSVWGSLRAERLQIVSFGFRSLENVELHFTVSNEPIWIGVSEPSSLSQSAIKVEWNNKILKIEITTLPSGERFNVDIFHIGMSDGLTHRLRGTGGKYKIVDLELRKLIRNGFIDWIGLMVAFTAGSLFMAWSLSSPPSVPAPAQIEQSR